MADAHPYALPKGSKLEEYEVVRVLGAGGFGITYLAFDHLLDGPVALKEYFAAEVATRAAGGRVAAMSPAQREVFAWGLDRFIDEARSIHRLRHANVVRAHRYVKAQGTAYIVMEYVEGESLQAILDERGRLTADEWRRWLDPLLDGLAHVHGHGYLHRDIKPANIVIRAADGEPVLIDFGAARVAARERTHTQVLTPGYAPIEQYSSEGIQGPPTDIYALAAVSYRVLTAKRLPSAPDRVLDGRYEPLAGRIPRAGRAWLAAIDQGLALRPEDRPQTVEEWGDAAAAGAGLSFSDEQYEHAKPLFQKAWKEAQAAAWDFGDFVDWLVDQLIEKFGVDVDSAFDTVERFTREQVEADRAEEREPADGRPGRPTESGAGTAKAGREQAGLPPDRDGNQPGAGEEARPGEPRYAGTPDAGADGERADREGEGDAAVGIGNQPRTPRRRTRTRRQPSRRSGTGTLPLTPSRMAAILSGARDHRREQRHADGEEKAKRDIVELENRIATRDGAEIEEDQEDRHRPWWFWIASLGAFSALTMDETRDEAAQLFAPIAPSWLTSEYMPFVLALSVFVLICILGSIVDSFLSGISRVWRFLSS